MNRMLLLAAACSAACSTTFDLSDLEQPILLNSDYPPVANAWEKIATYRSRVGDFKVGSGGVSPNGRSTSQVTAFADNPAQVEAFQLVGGRSDRALIDFTLHYHALSVYALLFISMDRGIEATAKAVQAVPRAAEGRP